jgi:hypothetical protein
MPNESRFHEKTTACLQGRRSSTRSMIVELLRNGIAATEAQDGKVPKSGKLRGGFIQSTEGIEAAINWGRD